MACCPTDEQYGYDGSRFEKAVDAHFHCSICYNVLKEPMTCRNNEHIFCRGCITEHLTVNSHTCPECNEDLTVETLRKARLASNYLSELKIKCDYSNRGCQEYIRLEKLDSHVENCGFAPVKCSNEECQMVVNKHELIHHESAVCEYRKVKCHNCVKIEQDVEEMKEKIEKEVGAMKEQVTKKIDAIEGEVGNVKGIVVQMLDKLTVLEHTVRMVSSNKVSDTIREDIIIIAGYDSEFNVRKSVERFSWKNNVWIKMASLNIGRVYFTSFIFGDELYLVGGATESTVMEVLNLKKEPAEWYISAINVPCHHYGHRTVVYRNCAICIGGSDAGKVSDDGHVNIISEVCLTSPYTSKLLGLMPDPRKFFSAELFEDRILIFGGRMWQAYDGTVDSVLEFDLNTNECRTLPPLPHPISGLATVRWGDKVVLIGGRNKEGRALNQVLMYDSTTGNTDVLPSMLEARVSPCAVITGNMIVVMGGANTESNELASVEAFVLGGYSWEYLPPLNEGRSGATAELLPAKFNKSWP